MNKALVLLLITAITWTSNIFSQRANLNREHFKVSYVDLPVNPILDNSKRTYTSTRGIVLEGFSRVAQGGTLDFSFHFNGTEIGEVDIKKNKHEKKDDDGNVVSTTYTYDVLTDYSSSSTLTVTDTEGEGNKTYSFSDSNRFSKTGFSTYSKASNYYNNNRYTLRTRYRNAHRNSMIAQANSRMNHLYGYVPYTSTNTKFFWIIATKKHPEYVKHQEAYAALKEIFSKMEYDQPVDAIAKEVEPWIDYFNDVATRFNEDDKKHRKVRYASYYNIAQIYYYLDQPEKAKEYADKLITNDYDKKDGKRFIKNSDELIADFEKNQIKTRHFEVITEDISNEPEEEVVYEDDPSEEVQKEVAFLITNANDTIQTFIAVDDLKKMSTSLNIYDEKSTPKQVTASDSKKIVTTSGVTLDVVSFSSAVLSDKAPSAKFVKAVYEGTHISLYEHMGKEYVLKFKDKEEGISTMSKDFVFGANKKLASYCGDCEDLKTKVMASEYKNTKEGLLAFNQKTG